LNLIILFLNANQYHVFSIKIVNRKNKTKQKKGIVDWDLKFDISKQATKNIDVF
jgi:hypothetical protein